MDRGKLSRLDALGLPLTWNGSILRTQTFFVTLFSATNANISDPNASGVIRNS